MPPISNSVQTPVSKSVSETTQNSENTSLAPQITSKNGHQSTISNDVANQAVALIQKLNNSSATQHSTQGESAPQASAKIDELSPKEKARKSLLEKFNTQDPSTGYSR